MDSFSSFREDVRVFWWWEDAVEVGLMEAFPCCEDFSPGGRRREGEFVRRNAYDRAIAFVDLNVIYFRVASPCAPHYPTVSSILVYLLMDRSYLSKLDCQRQGKVQDIFLMARHICSREIEEQAQLVLPQTSSTSAPSKH